MSPTASSANLCRIEFVPVEAAACPVPAGEKLGIVFWERKGGILEA